MKRRKHDLLPSRLVCEAIGTPGRPLPGFQAAPAILPAGVSDAPLTMPGDAAERDAVAPPRPDDFSRVRVHTDDRAAEAARAVGARAFTVGSHIVFGQGEYAPQSAAGRELLSHELAHVRQNLDGASTRIARKTPAPPPPEYITKGVTVDRADIEAAPTSSYWTQKVAAKFQPILMTSDKGSVMDRFKADREEQDAVLSIVAEMMPDAATLTEDKVVAVDIPVRPGVATSKALRYQFTFAKKGKTTEVKIELLEEGGKPSSPVRQPPAGYSAKDFQDWELEQLQARAVDKLGKIDGLDKVPADEQYSVKFAIRQYFTAGKARNAEVDTIVPIARTSKNVFYTFRFAPKSNDVSVERLGQEGDPFPQDAQKKDKRILSLTGIGAERIAGAQTATDTTAFTTWAGKRYPGVAVKGTTIEEMRASLTAQIRADAGTPAWFKKNYSMDVLDATGGAARLKTYLETYIKQPKRKTPAALTAQTRDMKTYQSDELKTLESSLEAVPDTLMPSVKGTVFMRQKELVDVDNTGTVKTSPKTGGVTRQAGTERLITIFDAATMNESFLFTGGAEGVRTESALTYSHELGHVVGEQSKLQSSFDDYVKKKGIKPITWYAANSNEDFFAESFTVYQNDPTWMKSNVPDLFTWFEELSKSGKAPVIK